MRGDAPAPATLDRVRRHLVGLRMPRALEALDHIVRQLERGEIGSLEAIDALLAEELTLRAKDRGCPPARPDRSRVMMPTSLRH